MRDLLLARIIGIFLPRVIEGLSIDAERVIGQMALNRGWQIVVGLIGHGIDHFSKDFW
jgi:hypothetical protein